jgi:hypothetical protein
MANVYAAFDDRSAAERALARLTQDPEVEQAHLHLERPPATDLPLEETRAKIGIFSGALLGAAAAALIGLVASGLSGGPLGGGALVGAIGGAMLGALAGGLSFSVDRDARVARRLEYEFARGRCVLLFHTSRRHAAEMVERLRRWGSRRVARLS